jgi:outer membrane protein OmpA-like peptidoglycan-associated protein
MNGRALALLAVLLGACSAPDRIILLPDDQGRVGMLNVGNAGGDTLLDSAYASASARGKHKAEAGHLDSETVKQKFGTLLAALPRAPEVFNLYFDIDSDDLTPESRAMAPTILAEITKFPAAEVVVIGHTDTLGADDYNDQLSLDRADAVKHQLVALGFDGAHIKVEGRGKRDPEVPTADGVSQPRNRRAEVLLR